MTVLNQIYQNQLQKEVTINENFSATSIAGIFSDRGNHNGLNYNFYGGRYQKQDGTQGNITNGFISLSDNTINYVYFNLQNEVIEKTTASIPLNCFPIAKITTSSGSIVSIEDLRVLALYANGTPTNLSYTLPIASTSFLGGIKVDGITCTTDANGVLTVAGSVPAIIKKTTTTQTSNITTLGNITELFSSISPNSVYEVEAFIIFQSAATTTGLNLGFTSPTDCVCNLEVVVPIASATASTQLRRIFPSATDLYSGNVLGTGVTAINSNHSARISGILNTGATTGNFQLTFASEVSSSNIIIQPNSILKLKKIA